MTVAVTVSHSTTVTGSDQAGKEINKDQWNGVGAHTVVVTETTTVNNQSQNYTTVAGDANNVVRHPSTDNNARTFTIDSNANVPYAIGTSISFENEANTLTIAITSDTMTLAGGTSTGSRTLAAYGMATAVKMTSTTWIIVGVNLT